MTHSTRSHLPWLSFVLAGCLVASTQVVADDWPQWRGLDRLAVWHETGIVDQLPDELEFTWRVPIRSGYSGPGGGRRRSLSPTGRKTRHHARWMAPSGWWCWDEQTGELLWTHEWPTSYRMLMFSYAVGPRATPTVDGDRVYVVGATGRLLLPERGDRGSHLGEGLHRGLRHQRTDLGRRQLAARRRRPP